MNQTEKKTEGLSESIQLRRTSHVMQLALLPIPGCGWSCAAWYSRCHLTTTRRRGREPRSNSLSVPLNPLRPHGMAVSIPEARTLPLPSPSFSLTGVLLPLRHIGHRFRTCATAHAAVLLAPLVGE